MSKDVHDPPSPLAQHRSRLDRVAEGLGELRRAALDAGFDADAQSLLLEEDRLRRSTFTIVVVGEFSRGKSTLINALLGCPILPARLRPTTTTIVRMRHGASLSAEVAFAEGRREPIPVERLPEFVTVGGGAAGTVREVVVTLDCPALADGLELVDTPGVNDLSETREDVTLSWLPNADAAIVVLDAKSCFTESERCFLLSRVLSANVGRVLFVVTKIDQLDPPFDPADIEALRARVLEIARPVIANPTVWFVAAKPALTEPAGSPLGERARSTMAAFQSALGEFLVRERGVARIDRPMRAATARREAIASALTLRAELLASRREEATRRIGDCRGELDRVQADVERIHAGWTSRVQVIERDVADIAVQRCAVLRDRVAAAGGGDESAMHRIFVEMAAELTGQLRARVLDEARRAASDLDSLNRSIGESLSSARRPVERLAPVLASTPILTAEGSMAAGAVMGVAALTGIFSPAVILIAGALAFLYARDKEEQASRPQRDRALALQGNIQEAAGLLLARLESDANDVGRSAWDELSEPLRGRLGTARAALQTAEGALAHTDREREAAIATISALSARVDAAFRDVVHA